MSSSYGTRRSSALQQQLHNNNAAAAAALAATNPSPRTIPSGRRSSSNVATTHELAASYGRNGALSSSPLLSSSAGKQKRPSTFKAARRTSTSQSLRPQAADLGVARSLPTQLSGAQAKGAGSKAPAMLSKRASQFSVSVFDEDEDDGEIKPGAKREKGTTVYQCEICSSQFRVRSEAKESCWFADSNVFNPILRRRVEMYKHAACLQKHRWEHTEQWQEASKLLLSKHQQVQLLEAAAILQVASAGASLPQDKAYWPAAMSPPSAGLLGSHAFSLQSPRMLQSLSLHSDDTPYGSSSQPVAPSLSVASSSDVEDDDEDDDLDIDEKVKLDEGDDDDDDGDDVSDIMDEVDGGMFDLDLGGGMDGIEAEASPAPLALGKERGPVLEGDGELSSTRIGATTMMNLSSGRS
ncbi:BZ3500_MvSof-1268-A1-R1_Chr1-2g01409 [Microbotryum saponariae]|uniref:BZ3500_MvSof-1268-A1-R1_Chr1-2g01409 protein n=1 Tax=Microbotryum saponariae TaxID=289078 RepID=A0A2X0KEJ6_9BASI|nr:BZ3500_MvSof-1268-A1-R1_Chr1-2g01409 [Microbotryum saponariae]SCZ97351.1 BZ3501_MvSof-1269-A2-R1_Chr1-2g01008 [Microbotryum saponariae]